MNSHPPSYFAIFKDKNHVLVNTTQLEPLRFSAVHPAATSNYTGEIEASDSYPGLLEILEVAVAHLHTIEEADSSETLYYRN